MSLSPSGTPLLRKLGYNPGLTVVLKLVIRHQHR